MRNWNDSFSDVLFSPIPSFWVYLWGIETNTKINADEAVFRFWVYLWGIETSKRNLFARKEIRFESTYEELKQGSACWQVTTTHPFWVYLWGIETWWLILLFVCIVRRFESTYEELKLFNVDQISTVWRGFESTYEELKPASSISPPLPLSSFESTYEELKLLLVLFELSLGFSFWVYLWGIETNNIQF